MLRKQEHSVEPRVSEVRPPYDAETASALEALGPPISLFRVFARRPDRARAIQGWGSYYLSRRTALSLRHRELVIDRTTAKCGADYELGVHLGHFAAKVGLDDDHVTSIVSGTPDDRCWTESADRAVLRAVDALIEVRDLSDDRWGQLVSAIGEEGAIDLLLVCGWYHAISFAVRALRLRPEPDSPSLAGYQREGAS
jgi:alkylhydroperoxidase family enzyme